VLFLLLTGFCWTIVYIQLIRLGFKEKTYGMPFVALALNFSWEVLYSYLGLKYNFSNIETWIILVWLVLDALIVLTYFVYGKKYFPVYCSKDYFLPWTLIIFFMSFILQYFFFVEFGSLGKVYSAFLQNLIMSVLFLIMLVHRSDLKGQSLGIAITKWIGTLAPTILFGIIYGNKLALVLGIFCSLFDLIYVYFINNIRKLHLRLSKSSLSSKNK
jgi:hypothetical protein